MDGRRRWGSLMAVLFAVAVATQASAQPATALREDDIYETYTQIRATFETDRSEYDTGPSLLRFLYSALEQMSGVPVEEEERFQVCAALVGMDGTPRLDGGGSLLSSLDSYPFDRPREVAVGHYEFPSNRTDFVVIDEFDLLALAVSIQLRLDFTDVEGFGIEPSWSSLYGFRVDVTGEPRDPGATSVPHGHLVAFHLLEHFPEGTRITKVALKSERHLELEIRRSGNPDAYARLHLIDIDFDDVETIRDAVQTHGSADPDFDRSVVMSWGLVDCALASRYAALPAGGPYATLAEYLTATLAASTDSGLTTLLRGLCASFEQSIAQHFDRDGFRCADASEEELALIGTLGVLVEGDVRSAEDVGWTQGSVRTRFYASAGNQALGFPMPPAAWPDVVGVEACTSSSNGARDLLFSNGGGSPAALALGAWFGTPEFAKDSSVLGYWGTSFAAPAAAFLAADDPSGGFGQDPAYANLCAY